MQRTIIFILWGLLSFSPVFAQIDQDTAKNSENQIDSTLMNTREKFVEDSLYRSAQKIDSLSFLKNELPKLMEAAIKSINEEIILSTDPVKMLGDSTLSNFTYRVLAQKLEEPYAPWRPAIYLSGNSFKIKIDTVNKKIISMRTPEINYSFTYNSDKKTVRMDGQSTVLKKNNKNYYKYSIDSAFFDANGKVKKIKKYLQYFEATDKYQKGALLYVDITQIKEFDYFPDGVLSGYQVVNYCDRWGGININQVCNKVNYTITRQGNKYTVVKKNEPENIYADGTFIFEFDNSFDMKSMEFIKVDNNLNRKCFIDLNKDKYVSRYLYEKDGKIEKTLLINYNNSADAKYKVETISCSFEEDGISYFQKNNTTGKSRTRDKLTLEWGPWK